MVLLVKKIIKNYNVIVNGKKCYDQPIDSDVKWFARIRKLTTGQGEDYTTGFLLDCDYIKTYCRLIAVDPKAIRIIEFIGQVKNTDGVNIDGIQSMFVLTIFKKIKETRLKFSQGSVTVLQYGELWRSKS